MAQGPHANVSLARTNATIDLSPTNGVLLALSVSCNKPDLQPISEHRSADTQKGRHIHGLEPELLPGSQCRKYAGRYRKSRMDSLAVKACQDGPMQIPRTALVKAAGWARRAQRPACLAVIPPAMPMFSLGKSDKRVRTSSMGTPVAS